MKSETPTQYIPALRFHWLTNLYDTVLGGLMPEKKFKMALLHQANLNDQHQVLDFGSGTATLSIMLKKIFPNIHLQGVDVDENVISIANKKIRDAGLEIPITKYNGITLPFSDSSFDRIVTSLVFHHLTLAQKQHMLKEFRRLLKPSGELHIADWGKPHNAFMRLLFYPVQILDGFETTNDSVNGVLPDCIAKARFENISITQRYATIFGTLELYKASKI